jgi:CRP/FNR family transcriptional regulator, cyclic AMP receptor protein
VCSSAQASPPRGFALYDFARMATSPVDALRRVPLFQGLSDDDLELLGRQMKERRFSEGSAVTTEGAGAAGFFVIAEGNATVSVSGEVRAQLGQGDYFGEIALIDEGTRSATITAATDILCYGLTAWEFRPFVEEHPQVAWSMLQTLARRLRDSQAHEHTH